METALRDVEEAGAYDQLTLYNGIVMLLYDQRVGMANVNVSESQVLNRNFRRYVKEQKRLMFKKNKSKNLKQEIVDNYISYKEAIERAYNNVKERS